jgi:putative ubiquitin-RnfH superfamily antitoxin RatB of RatAB toxin-antitoxin module
MEINVLVSELHELKNQRMELQEKDEVLKLRQAELEKVIKSTLDEVDDEYANLSEEQFQMLLSDVEHTHLVNVEVIYAMADNQVIKALQVPRGATIEDSIKLTNILEEFPEINLDNNKVGVFGMVKPLTDIVHDGERIEIYRPITKI